MNIIRNLEILLVETSGPFANTDKTKSNFDHHKGTFGTLAKLKTIADESNYADIDVFVNVKVFFIHATGNATKLYLFKFNIIEYWCKYMK